MTPLIFWASVAEGAVIAGAVFFFVGVGLALMAGCAARRFISARIE